MIMSSTPRRTLLFLVIISSLTCAIHPCLAAQQLSRRPAVSGDRQTLHVRPVKLFDREGFGQPILARTFLLPADWQVAGGVFWNDGSDPNQPSYYESFSAESRDGRSSFQLLPGYSWMYYPDPQTQDLYRQMGKPILPPLDAAGIVREYIVPNYRAGAMILSITPRPDLARNYRQLMGPQNLAQLEANGCRVHFDFVEARLGYVDEGIRYQEAVVVQLQRGDFLYDGAQMFSASNMFLFKAPEAQWQQHELIYATAMRSMRQNPTWIKAIAQFQKRIAEINMQGLRNRQQIMSRMYADLSRSSQQSWEYRQESLDRSAREFSESIRDVETYRDPSTGFDVELPNAYQYAYTNGLGEYVVTNDAFFEPGRELNGNWQPLQQVR